MGERLWAMGYGRGIKVQTVGEKNKEMKKEKDLLSQKSKSIAQSIPSISDESSL